MGQKMLQNLIVGVGHHLGHPFHVAFASLKQSRQILRGWREDAMVTGTQQILKAKKEGRERLAQVR
jgi:pyrroloquinoline quinone (PQQ) biosynthesis protein C